MVVASEAALGSCLSHEAGAQAAGSDAAGEASDVRIGGKRVTWDEATLAEHRACAGVLYGTQQIEESLTPFLYYSESVSRGEGMMGEFVPGCGISKVSIEALQERLGVLAFAQSAGVEIRPSAAPDAGRPLPPAPWLLLQSRSERCEYFYFNPTTREASWTLPVAADATEADGDRALDAEADGERAPDAEAEALSPDEPTLSSAASGDEEDEEVPLPS